MANIITQVDGAGALNGTADDDFIVAQHLDGTGVPSLQILSGGDGDDVIFGDHDELFVDVVSGNNSIANALNIDDAESWGQRENPDVAFADVVPYTTVLGIGTGSLDVFAVTVGVGQSLTVDLDYGQTDDSGSENLSIDLLDGSGTGLDFNDGASDTLGAEGSSEAGSLDPFIFYSNTTGSSQVVYIQISDTVSLSQVPVGASYMLNVSVTNHAMSDFATFGNDDISGGDGDDVLYGVEGDDVLDGGNGNDVLRGGTGNDLLRDVTTGAVGSGVSDDILDGGAGDDILEANFGTDQFIGGAGIDTLQIAGSIVDTSFGGPFDFDIDLEAGSDTFGNTYSGIENINGGAGNDTIVGDAEDNVINGGDGNDIISDSGGGDTINLGAGDDTFLSRAGVSDFSSSLDQIDGGIGIDTFVMETDYNRDVVFDMEAGNYIRVGAFFSNSVTNFENFRSAPSPFSDPDAYDVKGTAGVNIITGGDGDDTIEGRGGADRLDGGAGIDTLSYASSNAGVSVSLEINDVGGGHAIGDSISNFENVTGSAFNDDLIGDDTDTILIGGAGNDRLMGLGGRDEMYGGEDDDLLRAGSTPADVVAGEIYDGGAGFDTIRVENASSTDFTTDLRDVTLTDLERLSFFITGSTSAPGIRVAQLNAAQAIGSGIQEIEAVGRGLASATFNTEVFMDDATSVDLSDLTFVGGYGTDAADTITIIGDGDDETIIGTSIKDIINAGGGNDTIVGSAGDDDLDGGAGIDTLNYINSDARVTINLEIGAASGGHAAGDTISGFENVIGSAFNDDLAGDGGENLLYGEEGNDTLRGLAGRDEYYGGAGDDIFRVGNVASDVVAGEIFNGGAGTDSITLASAGIGAEREYELRGSTFSSVERLEFNTQPGSFSGDMSARIDVAQVASSGLSTLAVDNRDGSSSFNVEMIMGGATFLNLAGFSFEGGYGELGDRMTVFGDNSAETVIGSEISDVAFLGDGVDSFIASPGADDVDLGGGDDFLKIQTPDLTLDPGADFEGGLGNDIILVEANGVHDLTAASLTGFELLQFFINGGGERTVRVTGEQILGIGAVDGNESTDGIDKLEIVVNGAGNVDFSTLSFVDWATGSGTQTDMVTIIDNNIAGQTIVGTDQDDLFVDDASPSSASVDTLFGLGGNDRFTFTSNSFLDDIDGGSGTDTADFSNLAAPVIVNLAAGTVVNGGSNSSIADVENITGTGVGDTLTGDAGDNVIFGLAGNDIIEGGAGADTLDGGDGIDTLSYQNSSSGVRADLSTNTFLFGDAAGDVISGFEKVIGTAFSDILIAGNGESVVNGGGGADSVVGREGRDELFGEDGDDRLVAGSNGDHIVAGEIYDGGAGQDKLVIANSQTAGRIYDFTGAALASIETLEFAMSSIDTLPTVTAILSIEQALTMGLQEIAVVERFGATETFITRFEMGDTTSADLSGLSFGGGYGTLGERLIINGDSDSETIIGTTIGDEINGGFGNDQIFGGAGDDILAGGGGDDLLDGGDGIDTVSYADAGFDVAVFLNRSDDVGAGQGADTFISIENVIGSDFNDRINGNAADNHLIGGDGNDQLFGLAGNDTLDGGAGDDEINGAGGDDTLIGGDGNDQLFGLGGADFFDGGDGDDLIEGGLGVDTIYGGAGNDDIFGLFGFENIFGGDGDDNIRADGSGDTVDGGAGNDRIVGGNGKDILFGGAGNDVLFGGFAFTNGDTLRDVFVFKSAANGGGGFDIIRDFEDTTDKLDFSESGYTSYEEVFADAVQAGANVEINLDFGGGIVRINNFDLADLTAGDFLF